MKKFFAILILFLSFIFILQFWKTQPTMSFDLTNCAEKDAVKSLYGYILAQEKSSPQKLQEQFGISPENIQAFEFDLNNDKNNEILGIIYSTYYYSSIDGYHLFILQKENGIYNDISSGAIKPTDKNLLVLKKQKNNPYIQISFSDNICKYDKSHKKYTCKHINMWNTVKHYLWLKNLNK